MARLVNVSCSFGVSQEAQQRRRLELRNVTNLSVNHSLRSKDVDKWDSCEHVPLCRSLMRDLSAVIGEFGYSWDRNLFYNPNLYVCDNGILYSPENLPKKEVVQKLTQLSDEYTHRMVADL